MAHYPKLEIFTISLKTTTTKTENTFATYLENAFRLQRAAAFDVLYKRFFAHLVKQIDNTYHRDDKRKKAIGIKPKRRGDAVDHTISFASDKTVIDGTIKGGRYGQRRAIGNMEKPEDEHTEIDQKKIVLDDFYFLLYTPLGSNKGILMLQSYTDDTIRDVFTGFIRQLLKTEGFYKPHVSPYCPTFIKEEFKKHSVVKEVRYRHDIYLNDIENNQNIDTDEIAIEIKITSKNEGERLGTFGIFRDAVEKFKMRISQVQQISLEDFNTKVGTLANGTHISSFELDSDFDIKPTIFLEDKIDLQDDDTPNWESLRDYCRNLLLEVIPEVYPENEIP